MNALRGGVTAATTGAAYAAADRGTLGERLGAAREVATSPVTWGLGAGAGALAPAARKTKAPKPKTDGDVLAEVGVSTTIPQRMGRAAKGVEDLLRRFPITGQAMAGAQDRQIEQLNRAIGLKALQPIGRGIPKEVKPGFEMVQYVDDALGSVYDDAAKLAPRVQLDDELLSQAEQIGARRVDLAESDAAQFDRIVKDRLTRLSSGEASGEMVKKIHSELGGLQAEASRQGKDTLASMLGDTRRALMGLIERTNPEAGKLIRRADEGWAVYSIMNDAAAKASNRGGIFLPGQLNTEVRSAGRSVGSNMTGKGKAPLQDIATAAARTIPDSFGNPGTANATLLAGGGWGAITDPVSTGAAATGLTAAATPYFLMARKVLEELPETASVQQLTQAERRLAAMASREPSVEALRREVAARLAAAMGLFSASAAAAQPAADASSQ